MPSFTRHVLRAACLTVAAWASCSSVHARSASITLYTGGSYDGGGPTDIMEISGHFAVSLPSPLTDALAADGLAVMPVTGAPLPVRDGDAWTLDMPLQSITGIVEIDKAWFMTTKVGFLGGLRVSQPGVAGTGALEFTGLKVVLETNEIQANVTRNAGTSDAVTVRNVPIMSYGIAIGASDFLLRDGDLTTDLFLQDVAWTPSAADLLRQSFQLSDASLAALSRHGAELSVTYTLEGVRGFTSLVPEPASWALMGLGLAGLGFARRRA